jgi:hypothetical protein
MSTNEAVKLQALIANTLLTTMQGHSVADALAALAFTMLILLENPTAPKKPDELEAVVEPLRRVLQGYRAFCDKESRVQ